MEQLAKKVTITQLELIGFKENVATLRVKCSKGTYVRSLADSISQEMGTRGIVSRLVRLSAAGVSIDDTNKLDSIEDCEDINESIIPIGSLNLPIPKWKTTSDFILAKLKLGQKVKLDLHVFETGLTGGLSQLMFGTNQVLILDEQSKAFGLGQTYTTNEARVVLSMRRLLL